MSLLNCLAANPTRPPDWRWQRVSALCDRSPEAIPPGRKRDGVAGFRWITQGVRFLNAQRAAESRQTTAAVTSVLDRFNDIFWAHQLYTQGGNIRHVVEAHILARSSDNEISRRVGVAPEVVSTYEALFYNVRERLPNRAYIVHCAIQQAHGRGSGTSTDSATLWKLYGYFYGPAMVDAIESQFSSPNGWCDNQDKVGDAILDDTISTLKLKAALAAKCVSVTPQNQLALLDIFTKFVEVERSTDSAGQAQTQLMSHIDAMMGQLPFSLGCRQVRGDNVRTDVDVFDTSAVELTYEETVRLSLGQPIAHAHMLRNLTFPVTSGETPLLTHVTPANGGQ